MKTSVWFKWFLIFAFLVFLKGGERLWIVDAVGFLIGQVKERPVIVFYDKNAGMLSVLELDLVVGAVYVPERNIL